MCGYFCTRFIDFMLADKKRTDYTNMFSPYDFDKNDSIILSYFKDAWNDKTKLSEQTKSWLSKIMGIENYFYQEINQQRSYSKKLNKYVSYYFWLHKQNFSFFKCNK